MLPRTGRGVKAGDGRACCATLDAQLFWVLTTEP